MMRWLYSFMMWLAQPLVRRKLARRGRVEPLYLQDVAARFGHYRSVPCQRSEGLIWIHAVSLGETRTAALLIARCRERLPHMRLLLTHGTATGLAEGAKLLRPGDRQTWLPWDTPAAVRRFLDHFQPRVGILMETELWPNLVAACAQRQVPLVLVNARMSEKSRRQARRLACLSRPALGALTAVWAQTQADAQALTQLGATVQGVFGNLKFDATPDPGQLAMGRAWSRQLARPVVMLASSREGEEAALLQLLASSRPAAVPEKGPESLPGPAGEIQWLIVPRHPQRFEAVAALIEEHGFAVSRRSAWGGAPPASRQNEPGTSGGSASVSSPTIWLGNSLGEMALYYGLADVALLGGSFEPLGGQNLIEAAACACPVVMGPHTFNFAEAAALAETAGAALRVAALPEAVAAAQQLVREPAARAAMASAAAGFASAHRGAVEKTSAALMALLAQQGVDAL